MNQPEEQEVSKNNETQEVIGGDEEKKLRARELGDRMKKFEQAQETQLVPWQPYIVRLDGHLFSAFTKQFKKPYDVRIFEAMRQTATDLFRQFNAVSAYTQSDEITLIFPAARQRPEQTEKNFKYDGRINKWATLMAGFCSVRFVYHMLQTKFEEGEDVEAFKHKIFQTYFDARAFSLPSAVEILENVAWRIADVKKNSKNNLGFTYFTPKELYRLTPFAVVKKLKEEKGVDWNDMPGPYKFGCLIKRERYRDEVGGGGMKTRIVSTCIDLHAACLKEEDEGIMMPLVEKEHRKEINLLMEKFLPKEWTETTVEWEAVPRSNDFEATIERKKKEKREKKEKNN